MPEQVHRPGRIVPVIPIEKLSLRIPYFESVSAGFPSPADDYEECRIDISEYLIKNPSTTFFVKVRGDSMINDSIHEGDVLVVDKSLSPTHGNIVIGALNGEFTVKRLFKRDGVIRLIPANPDYQPICIEEWDDFYVWGVVVHVLHKTL